MHESSPVPVPAERPPTGGSADAVPAGPRSSALDDPRVLQILTTEHWSLLSARSLVYNEAFSRAAMFLAFLSMSFVALGLVGPAMAFSREFLLLAAVILFFDLVIGLGTLGRIVNANGEDFRALAGMNRIRHAYVEIAPIVAPYFVTSIHDDLRGILVTYGSAEVRRGMAGLAIGLTTTAGMVGTTVSLVAGVLAGVLVLAVTGSAPLAVVVAALAAVALFAACARYTRASMVTSATRLTVRFPWTDAHRGP
jgi:hypothetical protein